MENRLSPLIYELKGVTYAVEKLINQNSEVDFLIGKIQTLVNRAVAIIEE